jgi:hypothetical protein
VAWRSSTSAWFGGAAAVLLAVSLSVLPWVVEPHGFDVSWNRHDLVTGLQREQADGVDLVLGTLEYADRGAVIAAGIVGFLTLVAMFGRLRRTAMTAAALAIVAHVLFLRELDEVYGDTLGLGAYGVVAGFATLGIAALLRVPKG